MIRFIQVLLDKSTSEECKFSCANKQADISNDCWNCIHVELTLLNEKPEEYLNQCGDLN